MSVVINGSAGVTTNSGAVYDGIQRGTAVTASGTSVDFTSIPSWVRRITVMFSAVSTSGTSAPLIQLGAGSPTTSGYVAACTRFQDSTAVSVFSSAAGFVINSGTATSALNGAIVFTNISGNSWVAQGSLTNLVTTNFVFTLAGLIALGGTLDRVRITTVNGTDTFDAGTLNIFWE
jgi:hypothetical protein